MNRMNTTKTIAATPTTGWHVKLALAAAALVLALLAIPHTGHAQGVIGGMEGGAQQGAHQGGRAAGPVGAVVGGAVGAGVGGAVGAVNGVLGWRLSVSPSLSAPPSPSLSLIRLATIATAASTDRFLLRNRHSPMRNRASEVRILYASRTDFLFAR